MREGGALIDERTLSPGVQSFIEKIGDYFIQFGLSRVAGRLLGLAMVVDRPLTLDDMATALGVSRASVSTNIRMIKAVGFVDQVTMPRDRRDYYLFSADPWEARLRSSLVSADMFGALARRGLAVIDEEQDGFARAHLEEMLDFCEFMIEEERGRLQRWRERRAQRHAAKLDPGDGKHG
jgi:DNA-binding MarR family transcriptional regulator